jgi:hypothetical protein
MKRERDAVFQHPGTCAASARARRLVENPAHQLQRPNNRRPIRPAAECAFDRGHGLGDRMRGVCIR